LNKLEIKTFLEKLEIIADIYGVCDLSILPDKYRKISEIDISRFNRAIVIGIRLAEEVLNTIKDRPTLIYKHHYKTINWILDQQAFKIEHELQKNGYRAIAIPASQTIDWENQLGHISHKILGACAGLGWIGKSQLLINPEYGPRVRYVSILTNYPFKPTSDKFPESKCGKCNECIKACPANAITENGLIREKCIAQLKKFASIRGIGQLICGICIKACPIGRKNEISQ